MRDSEGTLDHAMHFRLGFDLPEGCALRHLKDRGLKGVQLIISDACRGLVEAAPEFYPDAQWQRCVVHFYRNVFSHAPNNKMAEVARMLKAIHAQEDATSARAKNAEVVAKLRAMKLIRAAHLIATSGHETLTYVALSTRTLLRPNH